MDNMNYINENNNGYINTLNNINKFDDHFLNLNSYYGLGCKVVKYMFSFTSILCISFFLPEDFDDMGALYIWAVISLAYSLIMHISPYLYTKDKNKTIQIFKLLSDTPINRKAFLHSRLKILFNYVLKLFFTCIIIRSFYIIFTDNLSAFIDELIILAVIVLYFLVATGITVFTLYMDTRE